MMYTTIPSLEGSSGRKRENAPELPPPRRPDGTSSAPNKPLPALPSQPGQLCLPIGLGQSLLNKSLSQQQQQQQQRDRKDMQQQQQPRSRHPLGSHPLSEPMLPIPHSQGGNPSRDPFTRKAVGTPSPSRSLKDEAYLSGKELPPLPQFDAITLDLSPTKAGNKESAGRSLDHVGEVSVHLSVRMKLLATGDVGSSGVSEDERVKELAREEFGSGLGHSCANAIVDEASVDLLSALPFEKLRTRVHSLMTECSGPGGSSKSSFDIWKERYRSTQVKPRPEPATSDEHRASRFKEELIVDEEDVADFGRWIELKRMNDQRHGPIQRTNKKDPRSPLELSSAPMRNINDSVPRSFLRKFASFGSRHSSQQGEEPGLCREQSSNILLHKMTSLSCMGLGKDDHGDGEEHDLLPRPVGSNLDGIPRPAGTRRNLPPTRPRRPARSPLDIHIGRMVFEDDNPFAYVECQRPMDAFRGLKCWSWYDEPGGRCFEIDSDWESAKKELVCVNMAGDQFLSIIADYENTPEYDELVQDMEINVAATEERLRKDSGTTSPHMGGDLNNAPMFVRHLERYAYDLLEPKTKSRPVCSMGTRDELDVPVMLEEDDYSNNSEEGGGGHSFDCAAALNGQMTFLVSDSEDGDLEEEAVLGAYPGHHRFPSGERVRLWPTDAMDGAFFCSFSQAAIASMLAVRPKNDIIEALPRV